MKKQLHYFLSIAAAVFFCINTNAQIPDTLSTFYGKGMDTFVANDEKRGPDDNFDGLSDKGIYHLIIRNHEVRLNIAYLKFDMSYITSMTDAVIGLHPSYADKMAADSLVVSIYGMTDQTLDDWADSTLTFNTAPGLWPALDTATYELNTGECEKLTTITFHINDDSTWYYSKPSAEMDAFINADNNDLVTFILLIEEQNTGDEFRVYSQEDTIRAPRLHAAAIEFTGIENNQASAYMLQNYPNPFRGNTTIMYNLNQPQQVELTIYNMLGSKVATLVNEFQRTGQYNLEINMDKLQLPSGIYFAKIDVGSESQTIKMINCK